MRALIDGALGVGAFEASVRRYGFLPNDGDPVTAQAVQNVQQGGAATPNPGLQQNYAPPAQQQAAPQGAGPQEFCTHGAKKWVPPGLSKTKVNPDGTPKPYPGFYACPAPRGQQCR